MDTARVRLVVISKGFPRGMDSVVEYRECLE